uniref:Uncharacterized protein n=2 Tax=Phaeomonas parva TaxID=124430 RepID=A0A7S1U552_9STRA
MDVAEKPPAKCHPNDEASAVSGLLALSDEEDATSSRHEDDDSDPKPEPKPAGGGDGGETKDGDHVDAAARGHASPTTHNRRPSPPGYGEAKSAENPTLHAMSAANETAEDPQEAKEADNILREQMKAVYRHDKTIAESTVSSYATSMMGVYRFVPEVPRWHFLRHVQEEPQSVINFMRAHNKKWKQTWPAYQKLMELQGAEELEPELYQELRDLHEKRSSAAASTAKPNANPKPKPEPKPAAGPGAKPRTNPKRNAAKPPVAELEHDLFYTGAVAAPKRPRKSAGAAQPSSPGLKPKPKPKPRPKPKANPKPKAKAKSRTKPKKPMATPGNAANGAPAEAPEMKLKLRLRRILKRCPQTSRKTRKSYVRVLMELRRRLLPHVLPSKFLSYLMKESDQVFDTLRSVEGADDEVVDEAACACRKVIQLKREASVARTLEEVREVQHRMAVLSKNLEASVRILQANSHRRF